MGVYEEEGGFRQVLQGKMNRTFGEILPTDRIRDIKREMLPHFSADGEFWSFKYQNLMHKTHLKGCQGSFCLIINKALHHIDISHPDVQPSFRKDQLFSGRV